MYETTINEIRDQELEKEQTGMYGRIWREERRKERRKRGGEERERGWCNYKLKKIIQNK